MGDYYPDDEPEDDDGLDDCGLMADGQCMQAGTEYCDWSCPYSRSELFAGSEAWHRKHSKKDSQP